MQLSFKLKGLFSLCQWKSDFVYILSSGILLWDRQPETAWVKAGMDVFLIAKVHRTKNM